MTRTVSQSFSDIPRGTALVVEEPYVPDMYIMVTLPDGSNKIVRANLMYICTE